MKDKVKKIVMSISIDDELNSMIEKKVEDIGFGATKSGYVNQLLKECLRVKE
jgi:hypothetical protein